MTETQCYWKQDGERCEAEGTISPSIHGGPPRFCRPHFESYLSSKPKGQDIALPIDDRVNQVVPRLEGESLHDWSMRCREHLVAKALNK